MEELNRYYDPVSIEKTKKILWQMEKTICKILSYDGIKATGFFCKIPYKKRLLPVLITNNHVIDNGYFYKSKKILFSVNDDKMIYELQFDYYRKIYSSSKYDVTIIEIKKEDNLDIDYVEVDEEIFSNNDDINYIYTLKSIYALGYPKGKLMVSYGVIKNIGDIDDFKLIHLCKTDEGGSGSPLLNINNGKVIGIHTMLKSHRFYYGTFLNYPINEFNNDINLIRIVKNYKDEDFSNLQLISSGNYGKVYFAYNVKDDEELCLKKINIEEMRLYYEKNKLKDYQRDLDNEIKILEILSINKNYVQYLGNYNKVNEKIIVMEKCDSDLKTFIEKRGKGLNTKEIKEKFMELNELFKIYASK